MMCSRIRENVTRLFECFCEIVGPGEERAPWILQKYPEHYRDEETLKSVPKFAFPCPLDTPAVQYFSFVLTNVDSKWTYGYCRHSPESETALVLLSYLPWHEIFYKLLNWISDLSQDPDSELLTAFLSRVYTSKVPDPSTSVQIPLNNKSNSIFVCQAPAQFQLPKIPENRNLTEYYSAVDCDNMIRIFASMLFERRIIFTSKRLYRLSACVQAANAIIYPMNWQHIFIPVLPAHLVDYLLAPMPYLIGVPQPLLHKVRRNDMGEVVILDSDNNKVESPFDDISSLPQDVVRELKGELRNCSALLGDGVSRAFLRALVRLIGGYRDALHFRQGEKITFDRNAFLQSRPSHLKPFLESMLHLQIFQQFIEERLTMLNAGLGFSDEFELEACIYGDKNSSKLKAQYKEWTYNMRKESSAFFKNVKTKANPAMKSAVKTVKERGKDVGKAYKGIKTKLKGSGGAGEARSSGLSTEPVVRPPEALGSGGSGYSVLSPSSPELAYSPLDMDLLGDLHDVLFNKCSISNPNLRDSGGGENGEEPGGSEGKRSSSDDDVFQPPGSAHQPLTKKESTSCEDLIRLDSDSDVDQHIVGPTSLANPLYFMSTAGERGADWDLLREYGLNFPPATNFGSSAPLLQSFAPRPQGEWAKFD